jgi:uncharacterized protein DUF4864
MKRGTQFRWAVGTLAVVAIALSVDSLRRTRDDFDAMRAPVKAIRGQLSAVNRSDYRAAYRFAAPEIQAQFPLPAFQAMVERGYPQIAHSRSAAFGSPDVRGDTVAVPVTITGRDGVTVHVVYLMRHEQNGWRVAGVEGGALPGGPTPPAKRSPVDDSRKMQQT